MANKKPSYLPADFHPRYATPDEVAAYARLSRREVDRRMRDGTYKSFLAGPNKRLVEFATVLTDIERRASQGPSFGTPEGRKPRGRRPKQGSAAERAP
jgi:hypothetical protein